MKIVKSIIAASLLAGSAMAIEPIQKEAGWSGGVLLGAGHVKYENNEVAGNRLVDLEDKRISDRGSPSEESATIPVVTGIARYTLENRRTEFFAGNSLEDYLRMDSALALGVRHDFEGVGILGVRLLASATPTDVWEDPLVVGEKRKSTERSSVGIGLKWERIMESNFEVDLRARNVEFDKDRNGESLVNNALAGQENPNGGYYITDTQQKLLEREGTIVSLEALYTWTMNDSNIFVPSIKFINNDRDGDARDYTQTELKVTHIFHNPKWLVATSLYVGAASYDDNNPVFKDKQDSDYVGGGINATYKKPFGWKDWGINGGFYASKGDSDINFYDTSLMMVTLGMVYSF